VNEDHSELEHDQSYKYDSIGNRTLHAQRQENADPLTPVVITRYSPNTLNQYKVNSGPFPNHDEDGNRLLSKDGGAYQWDAENRLIHTLNGGETISFDYDYLGRRYSKTISRSKVSRTYTIYDGWNPIADYETNAESFVLKNTRTWGSDLSGSMQGAGGVAGLLVETQIENGTPSSYYPTYDGNGNVSEYLDNTGSIVAHYQYDAFGNILDSSGNKVEEFERKFSTKRQDNETGLYYYGYRYYDTEVGRWLNRDPIEEGGGMNLYAFVGNDGGLTPK